MFGIYLISFLFTPKITLYSNLLYLFLGFMGLPIFAQFKGGMLVFLSPTIGFLFAFPLVSYVNACFHKELHLGLSFILSSIILYSFGLIGIHCIFKYVYNSPLTFTSSLINYAFIFIPGDLLSYILSYKVAQKLNKSKF